MYIKYTQTHANPNIRNTESVIEMRGDSKKNTLQVTWDLKELGPFTQDQMGYEMYYPKYLMLALVPKMVLPRDEGTKYESISTYEIISYKEYEAFIDKLVEEEV